jgi:glycyl-tRNA synthetase (class II)
MIDTVTVRDRDTGKQERIAIAELISFLRKKLI